MASELLYLSHCMVIEAPMSAREIANSLGKPYSTLLREVNPYDAGAKLGAETLLELMRITGDITPLKYIASELGYTINGGDEKRPSKNVDKRAQRSANNHVTAVF